MLKLPCRSLIVAMAFPLVLVLGIGSGCVLLQVEGVIAVKNKDEERLQALEQRVGVLEAQARGGPKPKEPKPKEPKPIGNLPPTITSTPETLACEGHLYTYDVDATDPDPGDTLAFSFDGAPTGMSIDPASGVITWTPTSGGDYPVVVRVSDGNGGTATQGFTLTSTTAGSVVTVSLDPRVLQTLGANDFEVAVVGGAVVFSDSTDKLHDLQLTRCTTYRLRPVGTAVSFDFTVYGQCALRIVP